MVLLRVLSLEQQLVAVASLLADAGIESRVLKGSAYAHLDYPDPALRSFIDLDLLFRPSDIARAVAVLGVGRFHAHPSRATAGIRPPVRQGHDAARATGFEIDLHRTFVLGPWGVRVDLDALWCTGSRSPSAAAS